MNDYIEKSPLLKLQKSV